MNNHEKEELFDKFNYIGVFDGNKLPLPSTLNISSWSKRLYTRHGVTVASSQFSATFMLRLPRYMIDIMQESEVIDGWNVDKDYEFSSKVTDHFRIVLRVSKSFNSGAGYAYGEAFKFRNELIQSMKMFKPHNYNWRTKTPPKLLIYNHSLKI